MPWRCPCESPNWVHVMPTRSVYAGFFSEGMLKSVLNIGRYAHPQTVETQASPQRRNINKYGATEISPLNDSLTSLAPHTSHDPSITSGTPLTVSLR